MDLLGASMGQDTSLSLAYFDIIAKSSTDKAVGVRKQVIAASFFTAWRRRVASRSVLSMRNSLHACSAGSRRALEVT